MKKVQRLSSHAEGLNWDQLDQILSAGLAVEPQQSVPAAGFHKLPSVL